MSKRLTVAKNLTLSAVAATLVCIFVSTAFADDGDIVQGELGRKLDEHMNGIAEQGFAGGLLVAKDGEIVLSKGYGMANREKGIPWTPKTVFTVGSITKQFTAAAILKLEMQGKLSVQDRMRKYIDGVPRDKRKITIHHLLTHSAGMRDVFGGDFDRDSTREWFLETALDSDLLWETQPLGEKYIYSNAGYSLLAVIIENVSGMGYEDYLYENLLLPAGMTKTGYTIPDWSPDDFAHGYRFDQDWGVVAEKHALPDGPSWNLRGNGGIHSTLEDMYKWHLALNGNEILSEEAKAKMFAPHVREEPNGITYYGYGFVNVETARGTTLIVHNGGNGIFFADFRRYIDEDLVVFIASNVAEHQASLYERDILLIINPELTRRSNE